MDNARRCANCYGRNGKRSSSTGLAWTTGEMGAKGKSRVKQSTGENRATLGAGLVSVSGVLVLGVLTLDYRINVNSSNRKRVNPGNSDAGFQTSVHHEIGKGISKRRKHRSKFVSDRAIVIARLESECKYVCGVSMVRNTRRRTGKRELLYV